MLPAPIKTLTIQEVSRRSGVTKCTLRFWEKELEGIIVPLRTKGGQRRYTLEHIFIIGEVKRLRDKGQSLSEIRAALNHRFNSNENGSRNNSVESLADRIAEVVKCAIYSFFETESLD